jgi:hypothetical protein
MLWLFFERTLYGKALRATAVNRLGARLMGISTQGAGQLTLCDGRLHRRAVGPADRPDHDVFYDSGFLIGLKGFVAASSAGCQLPAGAGGRLFVGLLEAFGSFWASAFKEVIVFTLILPVLLWRSLHRPRTTTRMNQDDARRNALRSSCRADGAAAGAAGARVLDHPAQLHRPVQPGGAGPGAADRRRGLTSFGQAAFVGHGRLHQRLPHAHAWACRPG